MEKTQTAIIRSILTLTVLAAIAVADSKADASGNVGAGTVLTPNPGPAPHINGPKIFGVRPLSPFLYSIPATGTRPMVFSADGLPAGLQLDAATGRITGALKEKGEHLVILHAKNEAGAAAREFRIVVGDEIALTPPMGWNSWNCWKDSIDQDKIMRSARALVASGLDQHGWSYINIDDAWQGRRGGVFGAIQSDPQRFPDMKALADQIHGLGLKIGIYSTPWVTSYAGYVGGSSEHPDGAWDPATLPKGSPMNQNVMPYAVAKYHFANQDAKQWAAWGIDYLKYDWAPNDLDSTKEMYTALRASGRDVILSLSNNKPNTLFTIIPEVSKFANCWRISRDIHDYWDSVKEHGFGQDKWAPYAWPGHWNDPDMFEIGSNGGGKPKSLTPDEQYTHVSLWCLVSAPLLLGCDLEHLNDFTIGLLSNDEVLDINQDSLGKQGRRVAGQGECDVYAKPLEDGSWAVGLFNRGGTAATVTVKWTDLGVKGKQTVRDLWRQKDLGVFDDEFNSVIVKHGVVLVRLIPVRS